MMCFHGKKKKERKIDREPIHDSLTTSRDRSSSHRESPVFT